jgi:hypothetical protein
MRRRYLPVVTMLLCLASLNAAAVETWQWSEDNWLVSAEVVDGKPFTMKMSKASSGEYATAQGEITRDGNAFTIKRTKSTDTNHRDCTYDGTIDAGGKQFSGKYICTNGVTLPFSGRILGLGQPVGTWLWKEDNWDVKAVNIIVGDPFKMTMTKTSTGEWATAEGTLTKDGLKFKIARRHSTDTNKRDCDYTGELQPSGEQFSGTYICTNGVKLPFSGTVLPVGEAAPLVCTVAWEWPSQHSDKPYLGSGPTKAAAIAAAREACKAHRKAQPSPIATDILACDGTPRSENCG